MLFYFSLHLGAVLYRLCMFFQSFGWPRCGALRLHVVNWFLLPDCSVIVADGACLFIPIRMICISSERLSFGNCFSGCIRPLR